MEGGPRPLAGRRSREPGFLLLRRQGAWRSALLRASLARRLSTRRRPPPAAAEADAVADAYTDVVPALSRDDGNLFGRPLLTPPSRTDRPTRSQRRAQCGSDPARGPG